MDTTFGRVIFNEVVFNHLGENHKFINATLTKGKVSNILDTYSAYLIDDNVKWYTINEHELVLNKMHDLGFGICDLVASSLDYDMLIKDDPGFNKRKDELFKDMENIVKNNDNVAMKKVEDSMVDFMKEYYKDNQMSDLYDSGAKPKWGNDLKTLKVAVGVSPIPGTSDFTIIKSNLKDGLSIHDMKSQANLQIFGAYNRAVETANGGYLAKTMYTAFQSTVVYKGDCKSTRYLEVVESDPKNLLFRYVHTPEGDVLIDNSNMSKFLNKKIKLRSPMFCKHKKGICTHCMGEMFPKLLKHDNNDLEEMHVGLAIAEIGNDILNKFMKKTHDLTQKLFTIEDLDDYLE